MPLLRLIAENPELALSSEETSALTAAFDSALLELKLTKNDPKAKQIAGIILLAAKNGERNPHTLRSLALGAFE
jgi:hypothetical protein